MDVTPYLYLAEEVARHFYPRVKGVVELDELIGEAQLALVIVGGKYESDRGAKFETFARNKIRFLLLDYLREQSWVPRLEIKNVQSGSVVVPKMVSAETILHERESGNATFVRDMLVAKPETNVIDFRDEIRRELSRFNAVERSLMWLYWLCEFPMHVVGACLGLSESRVSQMHTSIMKRLHEVNNVDTEDEIDHAPVRRPSRDPLPEPNPVKPPLRSEMAPDDDDLEELHEDTSDPIYQANRKLHGETKRIAVFAKIKELGNLTWREAAPKLIAAGLAISAPTYGVYRRRLFPKPALTTLEGNNPDADAPRLLPEVPIEPEVVPEEPEAKQGVRGTTLVIATPQAAPVPDEFTGPDGTEYRVTVIRYSKQTLATLELIRRVKDLAEDVGGIGTLKQLVEVIGEAA